MSIQSFDFTYDMCINQFFSTFDYKIFYSILIHKILNYIIKENVFFIDVK